MANSTSRGRSPARADDVPDDDDDDWTVYSDAESISSCSTISYDFLPDRNTQEGAPTFRFKRGDQSKPVYEAWNIHHFPDRREPLGGSRVLGFKREQYEDIAGRADVRPQPSTQSELADMHLQAIDGYQAKHKRCWASRAIRGRAKSYEQDLDERCRGLPSDVQTAITKILFDRGRATSTRYRSRAWTVVVMREQLRNRFVQAEFPEVKRHKLRFWKNTKAEEHRLYTIVLRGADTKVASTDEPITSSDLLSNPWIQFDTTEIRRRAHQERREREDRRSKRSVPTPSYRTGSASYRVRSPSYGARTRTRSVSPPSYRSWRPRHASPSNRDESPPPYRRSTRSVSPARYRRGASTVGSRSPSVRIRVVPRYEPSVSVDDAAPFPPTPPESFTPPPGVSAYQRPGMSIPPPLPAPYVSPFHPRPGPFFPNAVPPSSPPSFLRNPLPTSPFARPAPVATAGGYFPPPAAVPIPAFITPGCPACRVTRLCEHFSADAPCFRPVLLHNGAPYHPPCGVCAAPAYQQERQRTHMAHWQKLRRLRLADAARRAGLEQQLLQQEEEEEAEEEQRRRRFGGGVDLMMAGGAGAGGPSQSQSQSQLGAPSSTVFPAGLGRPPASYIPPSYYIPPYAPSSSRPPSWYGQPVPPAPNPFSPLSTPPLTSAGGSSPASSRARTPVMEAEGEVQVVPGSVVVDGEVRVPMVPMSPTVVDVEDVGE